jgi:hypothetical protein
MRLRILGAAVLFAGLAQSSFAGIITSGSFDVGGQIFVTGTGGVTIAGVGTCPVGNACIFWEDTQTVPVLNKVNISNALGGVPTTMNGTDAATITNMVSPPETVGPPPFAPSLFLSAFLGGITTQLDLTFINPGVDGNTAACNPASVAAGGQVCTPTGSLFNLQNLDATSSTVGWKVSGVTSDSTSLWTGTFTSQFNNQTLQQILGTLATTGFVTNSFSGNISLTPPAPPPTGTPEPASVFMIGTGLLGLAAFLRRRTAK